MILGEITIQTFSEKELPVFDKQWSYNHMMVDLLSITNYTVLVDDHLLHVAGDCSGPDY